MVAPVSSHFVPPTFSAHPPEDRIDKSSTYPRRLSGSFAELSKGVLVDGVGGTLVRRNFLKFHAS